MDIGPLTWGEGWGERSITALSRGERVASVASRVRGLVPSSLGIRDYDLLTLAGEALPFRGYLSPQNRRTPLRQAASICVQDLHQHPRDENCERATQFTVRVNLKSCAMAEDVPAENDVALTSSV